MTKKTNTGIAKKSRYAAGLDGDPSDAGVQVKPQTGDELGKIDNQYEAAGFAIREVFKNWKKFLVIISVIILTIGIILLLLLPGYKCQTESNSFEKSPVNLPGKGNKTTGETE